MWGEYGTSHNGVIYSYYKCASVKRHLGCKAKSVRQELIEKEILERVVSEIFTEKSIDLIAKSIIGLNKKENTSMLFLKKQHKCIIKNIENIIGAIANGIYTDSVKEKLLELEQQKEDLEKQLQIEQDKLSSKKLSFDQIKYWLHNILALTVFGLVVKF
jgi:resolvase domain protein